MRSHERTRALWRAPKLAWDVLIRGRYHFIYDQMPMLASGMSRAKRLNLVKSGGNLLYRRLNPWSMPLHLQIELANYCDLRCPVCPTGSGSVKRRPQAIDVGLFERLMGEVGRYLLTTSLWAWGEPLLHPRLDLARFFSGSVLSYRIGARKPEPAAYDAVCERTGRPPGEHLLIDDREANVDGAVASGWQALLFEGADALAAALEERGLLLP